MSEQVTSPTFRNLTTGDHFTVKGERASLFRFIQHVRVTDTGEEWIECWGGRRDREMLRQFRVDRELKKRKSLRHSQEEVVKEGDVGPGYDSPRPKQEEDEVAKSANGSKVASKVVSKGKRQVMNVKWDARSRLWKVSGLNLEFTGKLEAMGAAMSAGRKIAAKGGTAQVVVFNRDGEVATSLAYPKFSLSKK